MALLNPPLELVPTFGKPGKRWTPEERVRVTIWLNTPPQLRALLGFAAVNLGYGTTAEDAEDTWMEFCVGRLDAVIDSCDPSRGRAFPSYMLLCLARYYWREGARVRERGRAEQSIETVDDEGTPIELDFPDPSSDPDLIQQHLELMDCMEDMPPTYREVVVRHHFVGQSVAEIAADIGISETNVKQRLHRGRLWLRACLSRKAGEM